MVALLLTAGAVGWVALLLAAPLMPDGSAALLHAAGALICHQIPERSFAIDAHQLPVCGRCLGLYAGAAAGAVVETARGARGPQSSRAARWTVGVAAIPTALTLVLEWSGLWAGSNAWRCAAGVLLGGAAAVVVMRAVTTPSFAGPRVRSRLTP